MSKKLFLSHWKNLAQVLVRDDLMLKATDGTKRGLSRVPRKEPVLISIEKLFKEGSVTPAKTMWGTLTRMEEKMAARAPVTIPAGEFVSKVILGLRRVDVYLPKEPDLIKMMNRANQSGDELVEWASQSGIDLTMASWNEELIDIMHKLEDVEADADELEKIWGMILKHIDAHMKVVVKNLEDDDDNKAS